MRSVNLCVGFKLVHVARLRPRTDKSGTTLKFDEHRRVNARVNGVFEEKETQLYDGKLE